MLGGALFSPAKDGPPGYAHLFAEKLCFSVASPFTIAAPPPLGSIGIHLLRKSPTATDIKA
jgi:hypothetical protein